MSDAFDAQVREEFGGRCGNCGSDDKCRAKLIVPESQGGTKVVTNAMWICRGCELGTGPAALPERQLVNLFVSPELHGQILALVGNGNASSVARHLIGLFLEGPPERFDDLGYYQDAGTSTRLYVHVDRGTYPEFRARTKAMGLTVTAALIGLFRLYLAQIDNGDAP